MVISAIPAPSFEASVIPIGDPGPGASEQSALLLRRTPGSACKVQIAESGVDPGSDSRVGVRGADRHSGALPKRRRAPPSGLNAQLIAQRFLRSAALTPGTPSRPAQGPAIRFHLIWRRLIAVLASHSISVEMHDQDLSPMKRVRIGVLNHTMSLTPERDFRIVSAWRISLHVPAGCDLRTTFCTWPALLRVLQGGSSRDPPDRVIGQRRHGRVEIASEFSGYVRPEHLSRNIDTIAIADLTAAPETDKISCAGGIPIAWLRDVSIRRSEHHARNREPAQIARSGCLPPEGLTFCHRAGTTVLSCAVCAAVRDDRPLVVGRYCRPWAVQMAAQPQCTA